MVILVGLFLRDETRNRTVVSCLIEGCNLLERKQWEDTLRQASALKTTLVLWEASNMTLYHLISSLYFIWD
jgi:hypothetical protein